VFDIQYNIVIPAFWRLCREDLCRWLAKRSWGISSLTLTARFCSDENQICKCPHKRFFDYFFGFIVGVLQMGGSKLCLKISGEYN
jgi:hypothetical protein